jgi:hypothetical protein
VTYGWPAHEEIGIRMALGASSAAIMRLVGTGGRLVAIGSGGFVVVFLCVRPCGDCSLENVSILNMGAFATGTVVVALAATVAAFFPSRRATRPIHRTRCAPISERLFCHIRGSN